MTSTTLPTGIWQLDPSGTTVTVSVQHLGFVTVPATLAVTGGTIVVDDDNQVTAVEVHADASSYTSKNDKRNEHVAGSDFLDAEAHPTVSFATHTVSPAGNGFAAAGTVTVKGQPSPATVTIDHVEIADDTASFSATGALERHEIGLDKFPTFVIGKTITVGVSATATRAA